MSEPTPAAALRGAAEHLRQLALPATEGPWAIWPDLVANGFITVGDAAGVIPDGETWTDGPCNTIAHVYTEEDANLIAAIHPGVVLIVADWLDDAAENVDDTLGRIEMSDVELAHKLARLVLGGEGPK